MLLIAELLDLLGLYDSYNKMIICLGKISILAVIWWHSVVE